MRFIGWAWALVIEGFWLWILLFSFLFLSGCTTPTPVCPEPELIGFEPRSIHDAGTITRAKQKCFLNYRGQCLKRVERSRLPWIVKQKDGTEKTVYIVHYEVTCGGTPE